MSLIWKLSSWVSLQKGGYSCEIFFGLVLNQNLFCREEQNAGKTELSSIATIFVKKIYPILCLTTFPNGFAFATENMVHVFEKESAFKYVKKTLLTIPIDLYEDHLYTIRNIAINEQQVRTYLRLIELHFSNRNFSPF